MGSKITRDIAWDKKRFRNLETIVGRNIWPTPTANDCEHTNMVINEKGRREPSQGKTTYSLNLADTVKLAGMNLSNEEIIKPVNPEQWNLFDCKAKSNEAEKLPPPRKWPTPRVKGEESLKTLIPRKGVKAAVKHNLQAAVEHHHSFPTPGTTGLSNGSNNCAKANKLHDKGIINEEERRSMRAGNGGQLNPDWVEWLMGWPIGYTNIENENELDWLDWSYDPADSGQIERVTPIVKKRIARLKAIGNGQVPQTMAMAWLILTEDHYENKNKQNNRSKSE